MPAAAVIPAPVAYINVVAVKKLVVGFLCEAGWVWLVPVSPPSGGVAGVSRVPVYRPAMFGRVVKIYFPLRPPLL